MKRTTVSVMVVAALAASACSSDSDGTDASLATESTAAAEQDDDTNAPADEPEVDPNNTLIGARFSYESGETEEIPASPVEFELLAEEVNCDPLAEALVVLFSADSTRTDYIADGWDLGVDRPSVGADEAEAVVASLREAGSCEGWVDESTATVGAISQGNFFIAGFVANGTLTTIELENGSDGLGRERLADLVALLSADEN